MAYKLVIVRESGRGTSEKSSYQEGRGQQYKRRSEGRAEKQPEKGKEDTLPRRTEGSAPSLRGVSYGEAEYQMQ